jgi:hypothetical protein
MITAIVESNAMGARSAESNLPAITFVPISVTSLRPVPAANEESEAVARTEQAINLKEHFMLIP